MNWIRRYFWHVAFGLAVGAGSFELWQYALENILPMWLVCTIAVAFVLAVELAVAKARNRRARPHHRSPARHRKPAVPRPLAERANTLPTPTEGEA